MPDEIRRHGGTNDEDPPVGGDPYYHYNGHHLPAYVGLPAFQKLPVLDDEGLARERPDVAIVGAPYDEGTSHRPGSRFGPNAIRAATYHAGSVNSLQLDIQPFEWLACADAGDAPIVPGNPERAHEVIRRKVGVVMQAGAIPIVLGGDHSITWPAATAVAEGVAPQSLGIVHFDAHADTAATTWGSLRSHGTPMRRLIESGAVAGRNFVQVGLRGYWPPPETLDWMRENGLRWHFMTEIEERGAEAVVADAIAAGAGRTGAHLPVGRHRRPGSGHGAGHRHAGAGRHADPRAAARHPPGGRCGRPGGHGRGGGGSGLRRGRGHGRGRQPLRAGGDQRARRAATGRGR